MSEGQSGAPQAPPSGENSALTFYLIVSTQNLGVTRSTKVLSLGRGRAEPGNEVGAKFGEIFKLAYHMYKSFLLARKRKLLQGSQSFIILKIWDIPEILGISGNSKKLQERYPSLFMDFKTKFFCSKLRNKYKIAIIITSQHIQAQARTCSTFCSFAVFCPGSWLSPRHLGPTGHSR